MAKELTKKAGISAAESVLRSLMPELLGQLDAIRQDIRAMRSEMQEEFRDVDRRFEQLKSEMYDKFEQSRDVINEVGQRIAKLDGRIDGYLKPPAIRTTRSMAGLSELSKWKCFKTLDAAKPVE